MAEVSIGSVFAGYRIEGVAGEGGMGRVYRATQIALNRRVALKLIVPTLADDRDFRQRFERESELMAAIEHPNVIPVYEAGEAEGRLFIAMRLVEGTDLRSVIAKEGRLDANRVVPIVEQVAAALDAAHSAGLVHRDVKPANVMLASTPDSEHVYLTDFGLTKRTASLSGLTKTGHFVGTPDYMPPEQIKGERADARADVYALGCLLFHALTGRVPYDRDSEVAKMYAHLNDPPPSVVETAPGTPAGLDEVVKRALAKDADQRYPAAGDLSHAARAALGGAAPSQPERSLATGLAAPQPTEVAPTALAPRAAPTAPARAPAASPVRPAAFARPAAPRAPAPRAPAPAVEQPPARRRSAFDRPWLLLPQGVIVAGLSGLVARAIGESISSHPGDFKHAALTVARRAEVWALIGAALAAWLSVVRAEHRQIVGRALIGAVVGALAGALGGAIVAPTDVVGSVKHDAGTKLVLQAVALVVEGGLIGAVVGGLWRPRSAPLGLVAAAAGGLLAHLATKKDHGWGSSLQLSVQAMIIAACAIAALILVARWFSPEPDR
jgi:tRNA A-37 threonylcarbamoyl transferase component Bud32